MSKINFIAVVILITLISNPIYSQSECFRYKDRGMRLYDQGRYEEAYSYFEKNTKCNPTANNYYDLACISSLAGKNDIAFKKLKQSIMMGYEDVSHLKSDSDFNNIRRDKRWPQVFEWFREAKQSYIDEINKISQVGSPQDLIPYTKDGLWGYLDKKSRTRVTDPIFDKVTFVGETGKAFKGSYEIQFTGKGEFIKSSGARFASFSSYRSSKSDTLERGFLTKGGKVSSFSRRYYEFVGFSNNNQCYGIVKEKGFYNLIDSNGNYPHQIKGYRRLYYHNYGLDSKYFDHYGNRDNKMLFFYKGHNEEVGYITNKFKKYLITKDGDFKIPSDNGLANNYLNLVRKYCYIKKKGKWGIWNCEAKKWVVKPKYNKILRTERSFTRRYGENRFVGIENSDTVELYFLVKRDNFLFYIDLKGKEYMIQE